MKDKDIVSSMAFVTAMCRKRNLKPMVLIALGADDRLMVLPCGPGASPEMVSKLLIMVGEQARDNGMKVLESSICPAEERN